MLGIGTMTSASLLAAMGTAGGAPTAGGTASASEHENPTARKAAEEFEAFFVAQVFNAMSAGLETNGPFGGGPAEGPYRSMLNQEYAKAIAGTGGLGIADQVYSEIIRYQEANS